MALYGLYYNVCYASQRNQNMSQILVNSEEQIMQVEVRVLPLMSMTSGLLTSPC